MGKVKGLTWGNDFVPFLGAKGSVSLSLSLGLSLNRSPRSTFKRRFVRLGKRMDGGFFPSARPGRNDACKYRELAPLSHSLGGENISAKRKIFAFTLVGRM